MKYYQKDLIYLYVFFILNIVCLFVKLVASQFTSQFVGERGGSRDASSHVIKQLPTNINKTARKTKPNLFRQRALNKALGFINTLSQTSLTDSGPCCQANSLPGISVFANGGSRSVSGSAAALLKRWKERLALKAYLFKSCEEVKLGTFRERICLRFTHGFFCFCFF